MKTVVVGAPCKVNLCLDVAGVRADGYHLLRSVMQTVDLYDYLLISEGEYEGVFIECDRENLICDTTNTAYKAAEYFFSYSGIQKYSVKIEIIKNIPMQAGLGGGSSDAAAALVGLNRMYQTGYSLEELCKIGLKVGADVPFCLKGGTVLCEGVGDIFTDLPPLPDCFILIAKPEQGISTVSSFREYDKRGSKTHPEMGAILCAIEDQDLQKMSGRLFNVLEDVSDLPEIQKYKSIMAENGALGSVMTGSGSAVIGIFENKRTVRHAQRKLLAHAESVFITHPVPAGAVLMEK